MKYYRLLIILKIIFLFVFFLSRLPLSKKVERKPFFLPRAFLTLLPKEIEENPLEQQKKNNVLLDKLMEEDRADIIKKAQEQKTNY